MNEITLVRKFGEHLNDYFESTAAKISKANGVEKKFKIPEFSSFSYDDKLEDDQEFGVVYAESSDWEIKFMNGQSRPAINLTTLNIQVVMLDRGDLFNQVALARMALVETLLMEELDFFGSFDIASTEAVSMEAKTGSNFISTGIKVQFKTGN